MEKQKMTTNRRAKVRSDCHEPCLRSYAYYRLLKMDKGEFILLVLVADAAHKRMQVCLLARPSVSLLSLCNNKKKRKK